MITHEAVQQRSYFIWEREGRPNGRHLDHWLIAEAELYADTVRVSEKPETQFAAPMMATEAAPAQEVKAKARTKAKTEAKTEAKAEVKTKAKPEIKASAEKPAAKRAKSAAKKDAPAAIATAKRKSSDMSLH